MELDKQITITNDVKTLDTPKETVCGLEDKRSSAGHFIDLQNCPLVLAIPEIARAISPVVYQLQNSAGESQGRYHVSDLKPCIEDELIDSYFADQYKDKARDDSHERRRDDAEEWRLRDEPEYREYSRRAIQFDEVPGDLAADRPTLARPEKQGRGRPRKRRLVEQSLEQPAQQHDEQSVDQPLEQPEVGHRRESGEGPASRENTLGGRTESFESFFQRHIGGVVIAQPSPDSSFQHRDDADSARSDRRAHRYRGDSNTPG